MPLRAKLTNPAFADLQHRRMASSAASSIPKELPGDEPDDVLFNSLYGVRLIELNRPKKLNSLNGSMARKIIPRLREWQNSQLASIIMIAGAGEKAFCAGGDVAALAQQNATPEGQQASTDYFALEYQLDHLIATYNKPYISCMDGITMGGGVGLSVHAPFRIATERTVFAMPETTIGFFPDVGGSFFLPRLDGEVGTYLALTSERLNGRQAYLAGIATHYLHSSDLTNLTTRLSELVFDDGATYFDRLNLVNSTIAEFTQPLPSASELPPTPNGDIAGPLRSAIDRCFSSSTIPEIISNLEKESTSTSPELSKWASNTLKTLQSRSPTSLKVTLRQLREGKSWSISQTFIREHAIASHFMRHPDFVEGVSARLMSKPPREPNWNPATLDEVSEKAVTRFFSFEKKTRLRLLPEIARQKGVKDVDYHEYTHKKLGLGLPSEQVILEVARATKGKGKSLGRAGVIKELGNLFENRNMDGKQGLDEKIDDVLSRMEE